MKRLSQPQKLSSILSLVILTIHLSLSSGILYWAYSTASASIEKELNNSLDYRYSLADKILEGYLLQIGKSTELIRGHLEFDPESCHKPKHKNEPPLESHIGEDRSFDLDLLVISRLDGTICVDVSSKRFELKTLLPKIALDASNLTGGRIKRLKHNHVDLTILLHAVPFFDVQSGETTGYIIGGQVLNNNLTFLEAIRTQTDSNAVILFKDGKLIGATEPISSPIVQAFLKIRKQRPANKGIVDINSGKELLGKELVFSFRPLKKNALEVGLLTSALSIFELRQTFWRSGIYLSLFVIFIVVVITSSIRRIIARPLKNLLAYSDKILAGNADARHQVGKISEFNTLGRIMERMVDKLNKSNEHLSLEIAERKQAEDHVKLINVQLDNRVKERTLELEKANNALRTKIKEIEHTQQELRKLSKAIDQSGNSIVITDLDGTIEFVNPYFTRITGFSRDEAIGRNMHFVNSGRHPQEYFAQMWQTILKGVTWQGEIINRKKNGEEYWEQATISPIKNANGKITNLVAIKDDITERKRLEEQLRVAKERAESSTRAKSAFLANMSHEIRTPMNAIVGYIELALETNEISEKIRNYLKTARNSSKSLLTLINDILDISKMETGKLAVEKHKFYLPRLLHDVLQTLQLTIQEKKIDLSLHIPPDLYHCLIGDSNRLRQVLMNLVGNAIKFTKQGSVKIEIKDNDNGFIQFCVADTGIGMTPSQIDNLFQPFTQGDESTTRRYGGPGLGTIISRQLLILMGGEICVESDIGKGTTFYFTIPKQTPDCTTDCHPECEEHGEKGEIVAPYSTRRSNILIAEDIVDVPILSSNDKLTLPEQLAGIGVKNGLQTWQDKSVYAKALVAFQEKFANSAQLLHKMVNQEDKTAAFELSHKLKEVSGNLSIHDVETIAIEIDQFLMNDELSKAQSRLPNLASALEVAISSIDQIQMPDKMPEQPKGEFDEAAVLGQIDRLLTFVNRAEVDETLISDTVSLLRGHIEDEKIREVTHALENFDFEKAIVELKRIGKCVKNKENKS